MPVLPDVLRSDLEVVFCGTAAGRKSAELGQYYAGPGNKFWEVLKDAGFVPVLLNPRQFKQVLDFRIGLTDLNKEQSGGDDELTSAGFDAGGLLRKVRACQPRVLAFTSGTAARKYYGRRQVVWGRQARPIGGTIVWVLPSTSGRARSHWPRLKHHWCELAEFLRSGQELAHLVERT